MGNDNGLIVGPTKFVNLHGHSGFSIGDGFGTPAEHIDYVISTGGTALALTDHGNMSGISHQKLYEASLIKKGINFRAIPGVEAYFIDSLNVWKTTREDYLAQRKEEKANKETEELNTSIESEEDTQKSLTNPLYERSHLILLPKTDNGLRSLFGAISESVISGYYKQPRMDFEILRKHVAKNEVVASSACVSSVFSKTILAHYKKFGLWRDWKKEDIDFDYDFEEIQKELKERLGLFLDIFGEENFFLELQFNKFVWQNLLNKHLIQLSKETGTKLVVTCDSHYPRPELWREREIYKAMARQNFLKETFDIKSLPNSVEELATELYPKSVEQLWAYYKKVTENYNFYEDETVKDAIERTHDIAWNLIGNVQIDKRVKLPGIEKIVDKANLKTWHEKLGEATDEDTIAFRELMTFCIQELKNRNLSANKVYVERLHHELDVIKHLKFSKYFLTYRKIIEIINTKMFYGAGRGSGGASLVCYLLDLTKVDPIKNNLLFARFLSKGKTSWPDLDQDFADRDEAVRLITDYFGYQSVVPVTNFAQLQIKSLIKDTARLFGIPFEEINQYTSKIDSEARAEAKKREDFDANTWFLTYDAAEADSPTFREVLQKYPEFASIIKNLFKQIKNISRHAGGVLLTENASSDMPLIKVGGELQTPWTEGLNFRHLEEFGFLKFDILGLGTLRIFEECVKRILIKQGNKNPSFLQIREWFEERLSPQTQNFDDPKVYKHVFWEKNFSGIFQFVQKNVQDFVSKLKPTSVLDLAICTSLFRPGPLGVGADKLYLKNRESPEEIRYLHPLMKEILKETSGVQVFQEDIQMIVHKLAGWPLDETDRVRKAFTKKDIGNLEKTRKEREQIRKEFVEGCLKVNNISEKISNRIFDDIEEFVKYSFNKSHSVSYATTSYQCAWFLTYYPDEWIASYVDYCATEKGKVTGKEDPKNVALAEAKKLGYTISKPDINFSNYGYSIKDGKVLVPGFSSIKGIGSAAIEEIERYRPYTSFEDLILNSNDSWRHTKFNKKALSALIKLEAFESLGIVGEGKLFKNYNQLHCVLVDHGEEIKKETTKKSGKPKEKLRKLVEESQTLEDWTAKEKIAFHTELAGTVDTNLIIPATIRIKLDDMGFEPLDCWSLKNNYWAIVSSISVAKTKTGKSYLRMKLFTDTSEDFTCFVWNYKETLPPDIPPNTVIVGLFDKTEFGFVTYLNKFYSVNID